MNWARRTECNVCNNPKFGITEARTGKIWAHQVVGGRNVATLSSSNSVFRLERGLRGDKQDVQLGVGVKRV